MFRFSWAQLQHKFVKKPRDVLQLRLLQIGTYVGIRQKEGWKSLFLILPHGGMRQRAFDISLIVESKPELVSSVEEIYRVETTAWGARIEETP